ncbi:MAG: hypothetical protein ACP5O4_05280 [bacterium]
MNYLKILKNFKLYLILVFVLFILFYLSGCLNNFKETYYTVFYIDKNYGYLIPVSFKVKNNTKNQIIQDIVYNILKIKVAKIETNNGDFYNIFISSKPDLVYDYDTLLAYDQLYFSFFYSGIYGQINFYFNNNKLILNGIDFNFNINKINTKIFNNIFNLKKINEGSYFLFSSYDKTKVIPIFLPKNYTLNITLSNSFNDKGLYNIKDFLLTNFKIQDLYVQNNNTFVIYSTNNIDIKKLYFLFFNSNLEKIVLKNKKIKLNKPKDFSFNYYSINNFK